MTTTQGTGALEAMLAHHDELLGAVATKIRALADSLEDPERYQLAAADLAYYLSADVLSHATAEEGSLYPAAVAIDGLAGTVEEMIKEHRQLAAAIERLGNARLPGEALAEARGIGSLFASHVAKENEVLLPALVADGSVDLDGLLVRMHRLFEAAR